MKLFLKIKYDGTKYAGYQVQNNAPTIQRELNNITKDRKFKNAMLRIFVHPEVLQRLKTLDAEFLEDIEQNSTLQLSFRADEGLNFESFRITDEITGEQYFPEVEEE